MSPRLKLTVALFTAVAVASALAHGFLERGSGVLAQIEVGDDDPST